MSNFMHRIFLGAILFFGVCVFVPGIAVGTAHVDDQTSAFLGNRGVGVGTQTRDVRSVVSNIIRGSLGILGVLFIAYAFYGGMLILTSAGDEDKVDTGKSTLRTATIGIVVILSALGLTTFITNVIIDSTGNGDEDSYFEFGVDPNRSLPLPPEDPTRGTAPNYPSPF